MTRWLFSVLLWVGFCLRALLPFVLYPLLALGVYFACLRFFVSVPVGVMGVLALGALAATLALVRSKGIRPLPTSQSVRRRLESDSGFAHQPLTVLADKPIESRQLPLWHKHQNRMRDTLKGARYTLRMPALDVTSLDPYGLRFVVGVVVLLAMGFTGQDVAKESSPKATAPLAELWLEPPVYLHHPPPAVVLRGASGRDQGRDDKKIAVPEASTLNVLQTPHPEPPQLRVDGKTQAIGMNRDKQWHVTFPLKQEEGSNEVRIGFCPSGQKEESCEVMWTVQLIGDVPPEVYLSALETKGSQLSVPYAAIDDDAVVHIGMVLKLADGGAHKAHIGNHDDVAALSSFVLPLSSSSLESSVLAVDTAVAQVWERDLSHHPFAGLAGQFVATAVDSASATAMSAPQTLVLPQRVFHHETARAIVAARQQLFWLDSDVAMIQKQFEKVARQLQKKPEEETQKAHEFLGRALESLPRDKEDEVRGRLRAADYAWRAALLLEDPSGFDNALYQLRQALDAYAGADEQNREQAREQLAQALSAYNANKDENSEQGKQGTEQGEQGERGGDALAQALSESVDTQALQRALDQQERDHRSQQQQAYARHLQQLKQKQENLMKEETGSREQQAVEQNDLADSWRVPPQTSKAEALLDQIRGQQAMREAGSSLRKDETAQARQQQEDALGALERLLESTMQEMTAQARQGTRQGERQGEQRDPLGRLLLRDPHDPRVRVPKDGQKTPAARVADKLRDALRSPDLAPQTKDYLQRLLEP
ncbi:MAG: DUF4175 family protein [Alphaproteobacteria bacterium GM202ARS2]|nr:DUF4175 family protein [Alphaproteobacteria bacterium GM202ARS2]